MKKIISILAALALVLGLAPAFAEDSYIPAPYDPNAVDPTATYLEPVFYENENGPTIGVTTVGDLHQSHVFNLRSLNFFGYMVVLNQTHFIR